MKITVNPGDRRSVINPNIYGHFSEHLGRCIYEGIYVGESSSIPNKNGMRTDVVNALKNIRVPVLRWPGGCFADEYHWKDGIGEKSLRKKMVNTHWGGVVEDNSFGTHEFMELCEQVGCEPYISGNLGSGTVREMSEWIEYMTFDGVSPMAELRRTNGREKPWKLKYFGIGNESWGCGGNMRPEYYADLYRRYQTYCRNYGDNKLFKVACGPSADDYNWTDALLSSVKPWHTDAISLHYYTIPTGDWNNKGSATDFSDEEYYSTLRNTLHIEELICRHLEIMSKHDPEHKIGLIVDEWGCWYDVEPGTNPGFLYQQSTMRDAIVAALNLNIFNAHSDRVVMANIAQAVNVLQSVILTEGEKMVLTPTYHVFDMFKEHQGATLLYSHIEGQKQAADGVPALSVSVSEKDGKILVTAANASLTEALPVEISLVGGGFDKVSARILTGEIHTHNTFDRPDALAPMPFDGIRAEKDKVSFTMPPASVVAATLG